VGEKIATENGTVLPQNGKLAQKSTLRRLDWDRGFWGTGKREESCQ